MAVGYKRFRKQCGLCATCNDCGHEVWEAILRWYDKLEAVCGGWSSTIHHRLAPNKQAFSQRLKRVRDYYHGDFQLHCSLDSPCITHNLVFGLSSASTRSPAFVDCSTLELEWSCDECNNRYRLFDDMHVAVAALTRHVEVRADLGEA